jgi:F420-non-reducing hydrogenase iron-sulfur subunit
MSQPTTNIIIFACQWCSYAAADLAGSERRRYPANTSILRLPCTGRVEESHLLKAFENGADGVMVAGCLEGNCHYQVGNFRSRAKVKRVADILDGIGLQGERIRMYNLSAGQGANFAAFVSEFVEMIESLGPSPISLVRKNMAPALAA